MLRPAKDRLLQAAAGSRRQQGRMDGRDGRRPGRPLLAAKEADDENEDKIIFDVDDDEQDHG